MIEKISLALCDESGAMIPIEKITDSQIEIKIDVMIADLFSKICFCHNSINDREIKIAEKFQLAKNLNKFLQETKENEQPF